MNTKQLFTPFFRNNPKTLFKINDETILSGEDALGFEGEIASFEVVK